MILEMVGIGSHLFGWRGLHWREVTRPRANVQRLSAAVHGRNLDVSIGAVPRSIRREITDSVLTAESAGYLGPDLPQVRRLPRKKRFAAGQFRNLFQDFGVLVVLLRIINSDAVDRRTGALGHTQNIVQRIVAGVITAIAQQYQSLPLPRAQFEMGQLQFEGVIQSRRTFGSRCEQSIAKLLAVAAERHRFR